MPEGGEKMNRNISIIVTLLVLVVIVGYLIWLRSRIIPPALVVQPEDQVQVVPTAIPTIIASASATPSGKEATKGASQKSPKSSPTSSPSGSDRRSGADKPED